MPSTHLSLHYHIVFSTKERRRLIHPTWRDRLHAYVGGTIDEERGIAEAIGGTDDHVHILLGLRATHCLSDFVRTVKSVSSRWVHDEIREQAFEWQEGYGAFTVSASQIQTVRKYIARQEEHHRKRSFQDEYLELLKLSGVDFDERYLW